MENEAQLKVLRNQLDSIDDEVLHLLNKRMEIVKLVGELKHKSGGAIYRPEREREIIKRLSGQSKGLLNESAIEAIFLEIFAVSRNLELPERVAFLGPVGTFTHQASEMRFGAMSEYLSVGSIGGVFEAVKTGRAKYGVIPIENSTSGMVYDTLRSFNEYNLKIIAHFSIPIHHSFATNCDSISQIKTIYSKDVAFGQCNNFLKEYALENVEKIPVESTAKAAKLALTEPNSAAICPKIAAKLNNLPILFENIEDNADNNTSFVIISNFDNAQSGNDNTAILAKIPQRSGSLVEFLEDFKVENINLEKIESHIIKGELAFYIAFNGHFKDENIQKIISKHSNEIKILGSYVKE
ncbi:chorismate mutase [Arcobacter sp. FWKO B]|uniref:chorismate mutase n=1 Tax=Arcobacter sp. FWKO B TaxID=2593672 RepID=UPI001D193DBB|nr:chorismate mutase [Arcobacter sp. FWKO B]